MQSANWSYQNISYDITNLLSEGYLFNVDYWLLLINMPSIILIKGMMICTFKVLRIIPTKQEHVCEYVFSYKPNNLFWNTLLN